jgi:hypothetical protein
MAVADTSKLTDKQVILDRLKPGTKFIQEGLGDRDRTACKKFLDGSELGAYLLFNEDQDEGVGTLPQSQEIGNVNYLAINILTKVSSIAISDPDWYIKAEDPDHAEITRAFLKDMWKNRRWARVCRKALLKRCLSGMGCVAYLWNDEVGPVIEHVKASDLAMDPNVVDWRNPKWAARRVRMDKDDAEKRWPKAEFMAPENGENDIINLDEPTYRRTDVCEVWCYWDKNTEAYVYGDLILERTKNLYGKVPLCILEGDIAPESEFSTGDYDTCTALQVMLARLQVIINEMAENGGSIPWYRPEFLGETSKGAFDDGRPQGFVAIAGDAEDSFGYVQGETLNQAVLEAMKIVQQGLDSFTAVSEYQRGVLNQNVEFATQAALLANQSGSRGIAARIEYEQFMDDVARGIVDMLLRFGASMVDPNDANDLVLFGALQDIQDICVIESSTAYKDPNAEQQVSLQLLQAMMPFIEQGLINPLPLIADVLRAFGKRDISKYLNPQSPQGPGQPGPPGAPMSPGLPAQPPAAGAGPGGQPSDGGQPPPVPIPGAVAHVLNGAGMIGVK